MKLAWVCVGSLVVVMSGCSSKSSGAAASGSASSGSTPVPDLPEKMVNVNNAADALGTPTKAGEPCKMGGMRFLSKTKALYCIEGGQSFVVDCLGPKGIEMDPFPSCDISKNAVGDACAPLFAGSICDGKQKELWCDFSLEQVTKPGKVAVKKCNGPKGCYVEDNITQCDEGDLLPDGASSARPSE